MSSIKINIRMSDMSKKKQSVICVCGLKIFKTICIFTCHFFTPLLECFVMLEHTVTI